MGVMMSYSKRTELIEVTGPARNRTGTSRSGPNQVFASKKKNCGNITSHFALECCTSLFSTTWVGDEISKKVHTLVLDVLSGRVRLLESGENRKNEGSKIYVKAIKFS